MTLVQLLQGDPLKVDQASLTGESLPATKVTGDEAYSGSIVKQGEIECVVHATGSSTFFGKAAALIDQAEKSGHLQDVRRLDEREARAGGASEGGGEGGKRARVRARRRARVRARRRARVRARVRAGRRA